MMLVSAINSHRVLGLFVSILVSLLGLFLLPPIIQNPNYHDFADQRTLFGIPNFWNVVSNIPFVGIGAVGLWQFGRSQATMLLFLGIFLTGFGSERAYSQALRCGSRVWRTAEIFSKAQAPRGAKCVSRSARTSTIKELRRAILVDGEDT